MRTYVFPIGLGHGVFEVVLKANSVFAADISVRAALGFLRLSGAM